MPQPYHPHDYQKHAIKFGAEHATVGLFLDPGLGKTSIMLAIFKLLQSLRYVKRMLVIAPLRPAYSVWPAEVAKWADFNGLSIAVLHGPQKEKRLKEGADIFVINPEGLPWLLRYPMKDLGCDVLVVDESTRFKHTNTQRFKSIKPVLDSFARRYILTGTPAPNGLLDLFGQIYILDLGTTLGRYISHYRANYFNPDWTGFNWTPRPGAEEQIYAKLKPLVLRMSATDYLALPPYLPNTVEVELPEDARRMYRQMENELIALVDDEVVQAASIGAATTKCRQIANGGIFQTVAGSGERKAHDVHEAKLDAVEEILEELQGKPALVAYEFGHDLDRLRRRLGEDTPYIGGGVPAARFREIETGWNLGQIPVLLAQPQSVAHGLNLQGTGAAVIFHSIPWDLETYEQLIRRVWRQGQKERVVVHHIVAKDTVDEAVMAALASKTRTQGALLDALKTHLRRR